ncbi:MAG: hypothetical protein A2744_00370 [Candidatus Buchananbacteria bacterium RIFCSPHIGHO2_01_FULL_44_11]|uniref:DUF7670 domain-containing protein n=1 Tax=Candidatus Buchananbacteria bacterium RIFCSPHIGHO2_01_FULL_44_11 TaxID=1797535 RepID=A0A1G1XZQ2_9BACT|nr:MAG: hypothetical protein A2744_00370 [Candidatus Buchananbacteria bacterium RIFCSPHIGHO2_01_FULL_44_11]
MEKNTNKFIYWTPRVLSILLIVFLAIFSLDVFDGDYGFWGTVLGLLIHNIPSFILFGILIISWKYEMVGGVAFILAGMSYMVFTVVRESVEPWYMLLILSLILVVPAFLIGILFIVGWFKKKKIARAA